MALTFKHPVYGLVGDRDACGAICGCSGDTFGVYVRRQRPKGNPPPLPVMVDMETKRKLWRLADVRAWQKRRPGAGRRRLSPEQIAAYEARVNAHKKASKKIEKARTPRAS